LAEGGPGVKVFVTGAAGYIGSVVAEMLREAGHMVTAFDSLKSGHRAALDPSIDLIEGDVRDAHAVANAMSKARPDAVMHFAAESIVSESYDDPGRHFSVNVGGGISLLSAMVENDISKLVFSSTAAVYGEPDQTPITEESPTIPVNPYGESKLQFERCLPWFERRYGLQHVSLRYFNACGATAKNGECRPKETHLIPILLDIAAGKREGFKLYGADYPTPDGTCIRDYVHVADIARAHIQVLDRLGNLPSPVYNLGTEDGASNLEVIAAVERVTGKRIERTDAPRRPGDPAVLVASAERIHREIGWQPEFRDLEAMVASAWDWNRRFPNGYPESARSQSI